jgi:hypothetical protein
MKETQGIITYDAFDSEYAFVQKSKHIFLDLTEKSKEDMKELLYVPHIFKTHLFDSIYSIPDSIHRYWEYIYTIEIDGGKFLKIGYSSNIKKRLLKHQNDNKSPLKDKCGRITLIGPLRDGLGTEQTIHSYMGRFYASEDFPSTYEVYSLDKFKTSLGENRDDASGKDNLFEIYNGISTNPKFKTLNDCGGLFGLIQSWYYGKSYDSCLYHQDLIIPKVEY